MVVLGQINSKQLWRKKTRNPEMWKQRLQHSGDRVTKFGIHFTLAELFDLYECFHRARLNLLSPVMMKTSLKIFKLLHLLVEVSFLVL